MASNDVIGALYYKVVLDPRGFAKGAATVKSEQDLIARAIKSTTSEFDRLQAELELIGERAVKASEQERKILGDYQKQIIGQMDDILNKEKELERIAEENKQAEAAKKHKEELKKIAQEKKKQEREAKRLADAEIAEKKRAAKEALKAEKQRIAEEKRLEKELAEFRRQRQGRRFKDLSRYFQSIGRFRVLLRRIPELLNDVNGGLSKMAGNLAQAAGMSPALQGLARSFGAMGARVLIAGAAITAFIKVMAHAIKKADEFRKQVIRLMPLMSGSAKSTNDLMHEIMSLAARTGFATQTMFNLSESLLNLGMTAKQALGVGELLAGLAGGDEQRLKSIAKAYSDVMMKGRLMGQEALQFANAGIPIYHALAESMGKTTAEIRQMMEDGMISAEQMGQALASFGISRDVTGQLAENMKTVSGQLARINTLIDEVFVKIGLGNDTKLAKMLKMIGDAIELFKNLNTVLEVLGSNIVTYLLNPLRFVVDVLYKNLSRFFKELTGAADQERKAAMEEELRLQEEANQRALDAEKAKEDAYQAAKKRLDQQYDDEQLIENRKRQQEFEAFLAQQNITEERKKDLRTQRAQLETQKAFVETMKERIQLEREAAEREANEEAERKKRAISEATAGAGPSFGAGSTGEFNFLRDLILNRRERNEELKIMKDQKAVLDQIESNTQEQLDALESQSENFVGPVQPIDTL